MELRTVRHDARELCFPARPAPQNVVTLWHLISDLHQFPDNVNWSIQLFYATLPTRKMLKKSPRTEAEAVWDRKIGAALAFIRNRDAQQTQAVFAKRMGISRSLLANIERGRTPLTVSVGVNACRIFDIDPLWLCLGGKGGGGVFPPIHADKLEKIETHLRAVGSAPLRAVWPSLVWFIRESEGGDKKTFDSITSESNTEGVKSEMQKLRDDLKRVTAKPGMKAALARFMKVDPPRVSEWLAGQEPGGSYALKLRKWADDQLEQSEQERKK